MYCMVCRHDLIECECPDIEERLRSLFDCPMAIAAAQNLYLRERFKQLKDEAPNEI